MAHEAPKHSIDVARTSRSTALAVIGLLIFCAWPVCAQQAKIPVELELVLAVDASSSIQSDEFDLQVQGYANAFRDPLVIDAIQELGGAGIAVTLVQWSAGHQIYQSVPWTRVHDRASGERLARSIEQNFWSFTPFGTALGDAIEFALGLFEANGFSGRRKAVDISADERANTGTHPSQTQPLALAAGVTVNGLVVLDTELDLVSYFQEHVITGEDAFVEVVEEMQDLARSIIRKLVREISGKPMAMYRQDQSGLAARDQTPPPSPIGPGTPFVSLAEIE